MRLCEGISFNRDQTIETFHVTNKKLIQLYRLKYDISFVLITPDFYNMVVVKYSKFVSEPFHFKGI